MSVRNYNSTQDSNFTNLQNQVNDVKGVMTQNIDKILQRGEKLDDLVDKTTDLESNAIQFNVQAKKVKRKMWWKNIKMMIILGIVITVIIGVIILALVLKFGHGSSGGGGGGGDTTPKPTQPPVTTSTKLFKII